MENGLAYLASSCPSKNKRFIRLTPVNVAGQEVVGDGRDLVVGRLDLLGVADLSLGVFLASRNEGSLDGFLLRVDPVEHHLLGVVVDALDPGLVLDDLEEPHLLGQDFAVDLFAGAEQQLRVGALRGLADSAELLVGDIKTFFTLSLRCSESPWEVFSSRVI